MSRGDEFGEWEDPDQIDVDAELVFLIGIIVSIVYIICICFCCFFVVRLRQKLSIQQAQIKDFEKEL